jgi:hypothetical protein
MTWSGTSYKALDNNVFFYVWTRDLHDKMKPYLLPIPMITGQQFSMLPQILFKQPVQMISLYLPVAELTSASNMHFAAEYHANGKTI